jgi:hypothetical protein
MLENDPRSDDYEDQLQHHHIHRRGDVIAGWSLALLLAAVAAFALGLDHLAVVGGDQAVANSDWARAAAPPLAQQLGLVSRVQP